MGSAKALRNMRDITPHASAMKLRGIDQIRCSSCQQCLAIQNRIFLQTCVILFFF
jgi:hypothetical protein